MPREHGDDGEYVETVTLNDVLGVFDGVQGPVVLSADVSDALGCSRETARRKLATLFDRGEVDRRKVSRRVLYWRKEDVARADVVNDATDSPADPPANAHGNARAESEDTEPIIDFGSLSFKRDMNDGRRSHLEAWIRHAADADGVSKSDFEDWWNDERHEETGYNAGSFWEAFAKAAMKQSDQFTKPNTRTYRYTGDHAAEVDR